MDEIKEPYFKFDGLKSTYILPRLHPYFSKENQLKKARFKKGKGFLRYKVLQYMKGSKRVATKPIESSKRDAIK